MLLGDLMAQFEDEAVVQETLVALDNIALMTRVAVAAEEQDISVGEFAANSVQRFATFASDEDWVSMMGTMARASDPGRVLLEIALAASLEPPREARHHQSRAR